MSAETRTLAKKLAKVMTRVQYIQKRGRNNFHGYNYATEADVADAVRDALAEQNVVMLPSVVEHSIREVTSRKGNAEFICMVVMDFTFVDGDSGETLTVRLIGEGQDSGDKAFYKAVTGTTKYAIMKTFLIPTGDDPEQDNGAEQSAPTRAAQSGKAAPPSGATQSGKTPSASAGKVDFTAFWGQVRALGKSPEDLTPLVPQGDNITKYSQAQLDELLAKLKGAA